VAIFIEQGTDLLRPIESDWPHGPDQPPRSSMIKIGVRVFTTGLCVVSIGLLSTSTSLWAQQHYTQTNLVSDLPGMAAATDPNLVNPWGISRSSGSPWWVSDNGMGVATLYLGTGAAVPLVVTIPPSSVNKGQMGTPTGQIFNGTTGFKLSNGNPALFIFATEDGTVSAWNPGQMTTAAIKVDAKGASVFKGLAIATLDNPIVGPTYFLYAADFRKGQVAVWDSSFNKISLGPIAFKDPLVPAGFAPFNIQNIGGDLYVAFAKQDSAKHDEVDGAGLGFVDVFTPAGQLIRRLDHGTWFNAPWGITQAPTDFGAYSHDLLIGQFGSGQILVFDPVTGHFLGRLRDAKNAPIAIKGLWGINFGSGVSAASSAPASTLFFAAGIDDEAHGLFGTITPVENVLGGDH
jgi:uncharacterized protein (TIGR03118 family)